MTTPKISILLPTRKRTEAVMKSIGSLLATAKNTAHIEVMIGYDNDDRESQEFFSGAWADFLGQCDATTQVFETERYGYTQLNRYVNYLGEEARGELLMFWNDDALMMTDNWDEIILAQKDHPGVIRMPCVSMNHPFALFPIIRKDWITRFGQISPVSHSDWWIYNVCAPLKQVLNVPVEVYHDRADVTGGNNDETFAERSYSADGKDPTNPYDYAHPQRREDLIAWIHKFQAYLQQSK